MGPFIGVAFAIGTWLGIGMQGQVFDRPIPERCATFEQANAPENQTWCRAWFAAHRTHRPLLRWAR